MKTKKPPFVLIFFLMAFFVVAVPGCIQSTSQKEFAPSSTTLTEQAPSAPSSKSRSEARVTDQTTNAGAAYNSSTSQQEDKVSKRQVPAPTPKQEIEEIQKAVGKLPKGTFFHNAPLTMDVDQPVVIEAGITNSNTNLILIKLQGQGKLQSLHGIRYDPQGMEIELSADTSKFDIQPISVGRKPPITNKESTVWKWQVKPLKQGMYYLNLTAKLKFQLPNNFFYDQDYAVYNELIEVKGSPSYSLMQLLSKHWLRILVGVIAFSLGLFGWLFALKPKKIQPTQEVDG